MQQKVNHLSKLTSPIFIFCIDHHGNNNNTCKTLQGTMLCCADKHDYSNQEMVYLLLNLLLMSNTYNFVTRSLDGTQRGECTTSYQFNHHYMINEYSDCHNFCFTMLCL